MNGWRDMAARIMQDADAPATGDPAPRPPAAAYAESLERLRCMDRPGGSDPTRWTMILADAAALVAEWGDQLQALGWTEGDLFGFSDEAWPDEIGLALRVRGGRVIVADANAAIILLVDGVSRIVHYRRPTPLPPIWLHRRGKR